MLTQSNASDSGQPEAPQHIVGGQQLNRPNNVTIAIGARQGAA
jgi:hypothetical protein